MQVDWGQIASWVAGALLVLLGFGLSVLYQAWRDRKRDDAHRQRLLDFVRLEIERNRKVADGLKQILAGGGPARGYATLAGMSDESWRVVVSDWRATRLTPQVVSNLSELSHATTLVNNAISDYMTYGILQGAMSNYQAVLSLKARIVVGSADTYLEVAGKIKLPE